MPETMTMNGRAMTLLGGDAFSTPPPTTFVNCDHLGAPNAELRFGYDWEGRRVSKVVSNKVGGVWQFQSSRKYLYDGWNLVGEVNQSNVLERTHVWGLDASGTMQGAGGVGGLLATVIHTGTNAGVYFPMYDGNWNVMGYVRAGDGAVVAQYEYGPFGELLRATGPLTREFNFLFSTKYFDWETGLYYYGYRYYNPTTGRWLSRDPIEEKGGVNLYGMAGNDAVNRYDYLGLLTPKKFWDDWTDSDRTKWFAEFKKDYGQYIRDAAKQHCVPKSLLAAIIANEMIDYDWFENTAENYFGIGASVGPAQITAKTAIQEKVYGGIWPPKLPNMDPWHFPTNPNPDVIRWELTDPQKNIDTAARLMAKYLDDLCNRSQGGELSKSFLVNIAGGCKTKDFCCRKKSGTDCSDVKVPGCLIQAMAAAWNNGIKITTINDIPEKSPNAYRHAINAGNLDGVFSDF